MKYDFTTRVNRKGQGSFKWEDMYAKKPDVADGIVPLSVADMEFKNAPEIIEELKKLSDIILKNEVLLLSDEVHFDIIMPGAKHTVFQTIDEKLAERTITFTALSKTFNLAGMGMSNTIIKNKELYDRFINSLNRTSSIPFTALGYKSCEIAYTQCEEWLKECLEVIYKNQQFIVEFFEKNYPEIKVIKNEGTYLLWVDFRVLNMKPEDLEKFMIEEASVFLDEGYIFGENGKGFERFNLAAPTSVIEETPQRLDKALKKLKK